MSDLSLVEQLKQQQGTRGAHRERREGEAFAHSASEEAGREAPQAPSPQRSKRFTWEAPLVPTQRARATNFHGAAGDAPRPQGSGTLAPATHDLALERAASDAARRAKKKLVASSSGSK